MPPIINHNISIQNKNRSKSSQSRNRKPNTSYRPQRKKVKEVKDDGTSRDFNENSSINFQQTTTLVGSASDLFLQTYQFNDSFDKDLNILKINGITDQKNVDMDFITTKFNKELEKNK